ncbi:MAG: type I-MYXAN CRISPR-associated protein Cas6/Cmx6 [Nitrososphaerota archaeon]|nr:type I-MYXAN CRISPR-associated protein Cas6/Cmx6 [Nitrososphaerota archaeon]
MVTVDLAFRLSGSEIPVDHGYPLYSAISHVIPSLHGDEGVGIHPISGLLAGDRLLRITDRSRLVLRVRSERVRDFIPLSGKRLNVGGHELSVGLPSPMMLRPAARLHSRVVVIKGFLDMEAFLEACRRQLGALGVAGRPSIPPRTSSGPVEHGSGGRLPFVRRTLRVHDKIIVGYAVDVDDLSPEGSIRLQEAGLGGRRRFGCGVFTPPKSDAEP